MKYTKNTGNKHSSIDVIIEEYIRGSICKFKFKTLTNTLLISYESRPTEDENIEDVQPTHSSNNQYKLLKTLLDKKSRN